ncbi:MAG: transcription termination/antitermination protein NusA [Planctomycetes bacterium]|nr:transcription termination/antitermination protein NusA [Planctomycetota bacterium]
MKPEEILRIVDTIHRAKDIDKEVIFEGVESALLSAAKKRFGIDRDIEVEIDRETGEIHAFDASGEEIDPNEFGRIAAQSAKQIIFQKIREAERDVIYQEYIRRKKDIVLGNIRRFEGQNIIVNLGKTDGILPKKEQVRGERYHVGDRIRAYVLDVKKVGTKVKILLSRSHPNFIKRLFELEVPEIGQNIIEIHALVREAGYRTKVAVSSSDNRVDCVGACVGVRGSRIKNIIEELGGEKIDIIRWDSNYGELIKNALKPAEVKEVTPSDVDKRATVLVEEDQLSLAIGKKGQNVRLASRLCGWDIDIVTATQKEEQKAKEIAFLESLPGLDRQMAEKFWYLGLRTPEAILSKGVETLTQFEGIDEGRARTIVDFIADHIAKTEVAPPAPIEVRWSQEADEAGAIEEDSSGETSDEDWIKAGSDEEAPASEAPASGEPVSG